MSRRKPIKCRVCLRPMPDDGRRRSRWERHPACGRDADARMGFETITEVGSDHLFGRMGLGWIKRAFREAGELVRRTKGKVKRGERRRPAMRGRGGRR